MRSIPVNWDMNAIILPRDKIKTPESKNCIPEHSKHTRRKAAQFTSSFIQTVTVGFGLTPNHALRLVGFTTGRDLHPALKIII